MTGFLVVRDDDTLRDRLAEVVEYHVPHYAASDDIGCRCRASWEPGHVTAELLAVLRDVGTPATTEPAFRYHEQGADVSVGTRLVTDWTET